MSAIRLEESEVVSLGESGWFAREGFVTPGVVTAACEAAERLELAPAGVARGAARRVDASVRGDHTAWLDPGSELCGAFEGLRVALCEQAWLGVRRFDVQLARYPGHGEGYARHRDAFAGGAGANRRVTAIVYLNAGWRDGDGGELRLHLPGGPRDLAPIAGRLVVFLSERVEHEVLPARAPRLAATAWYYS